MKKLVSFLFIINWLLVPLATHAANPGEGKWVAEEVYRGANYTGMTGLVRMNSAYTLRDGEIAFHTGAVTESISGIDYTIIPVNIVYGLSDNVEVGLSAKYFSTNTVSGKGDTDLKFKWRFRNQSEYLPATSLMLGFVFPTADTGLAEVTTWGAKLNFLASSEAQISDDSYIGMYIDLGTANLDPGSATSTSYTDASLGFLFPISDNNQLQAIIELNALSGTVPLLGSISASGATYGLRYASESYKMNLGVETRTSAGTSSSRFIFTIGAEL